MKQPFIVAALVSGLLVAGRAAGPSGAVPGQTSDEAPPTFPAEVELVTVDAVVVDRKGEPVAGLTREDFLLSEDDVSQRIERFEAVVLPEKPSARPARPEPVTTNTRSEVRAGRAFAIVFDDLHLSPPQAYRAKEAVGEFLSKGVREGDRVLLCATSGGGWWTARMESGREELMSILKRFDGRRIVDNTQMDRMTDYEAMRIVSADDTLVGEIVRRRFEASGAIQNQRQQGNTSEVDTTTPQGRSHPLVMSRAQHVYAQARALNRLTLKAIVRVLDGLSTAKGRKSVILVSEGFVNDPDLDELRAAVSASRRANAALYFLGTRGLDLPVGLFSAEFGNPTESRDIAPLYSDVAREGEGSETLAVATGGFAVTNTNDLASGIVRIANETRAYYLIGYNPPQHASDGSFHKIAVKVNRKGMTVRARRGYFAPSPGGDRAASADLPEGIHPAIQRAVDAPFDLDGIPIRITAYVLGETLIGQARTVVAADIDMRTFPFQEKDGRLIDSVDMDLIVSHRESGEYYQYPENVETNFRRETLDRNGWYPLRHDFELTPGSYQAKLVVRERNGGRLGSVLHLFSVPDLGVFRSSTPIITDSIQVGGGESKSPKTALLARRTFAAAGPLYCRVELYNAKVDAASGARRVTHGYTLRRADGVVVLKADPTAIIPAADGTISRVVGFPLDGLDPGEYSLELTVRDEVAGKTLDFSEPVTLVAAPGA
jgi:VWFA-related protein